jgi:hypothetical protein
MRKVATSALAAALLLVAPAALAAKVTPPGTATISATCTTATVTVDPSVAGYAVYDVRPVVHVDGVLIDPNLNDVSWVNEEQGERHDIYFPMTGAGERPVKMHKGRNGVALTMYWLSPAAAAKSTAHIVVTCP